MIDILERLAAAIRADGYRPSTQVMVDAREEIERLRKERDQLRAFAWSIMKAWPDGGVDGFELQDIAAEHGLLRQITANAPCGEDCMCAEWSGLSDMAGGVTCYRKTGLLTGDGDE